MADAEVKLLADAKKLALPDRVAHTNWKARSAAYEDISAACSGIYDDADPRLAEYGASEG
jgi:cytoskeleton-associated protein 5